MIDQIGIVVFGLSALWCLSDSREHVRKWACIFGLCGEPFWLYSAWIASQWGVVVLACVYALGYMRGIYNQWMK